MWAYSIQGILAKSGKALYKPDPSILVVPSRYVVVIKSTATDIVMG
jgi:hypothetical protein